MDQFPEIERGVKFLRSFDDAGELFHRAAAFRQRQDHGGKAREQIHLAAHAVLKWPRAANLQNAHAEIVAPQRSRPNRRIFAAVARQSRFYPRGSRRGQGSRLGPNFRFATVGTPKPRAHNAGLAHRGTHHTGGNLIRREPAFEQTQPIEQFREKFVHSLTSRRFAHTVQGGKTTAALEVSLAGVSWVEKSRFPGTRGNERPESVPPYGKESLLKRASR